MILLIFINTNDSDRNTATNVNYVKTYSIGNHVRKTAEAQANQEKSNMLYFDTVERIIQNADLILVIKNTEVLESKTSPK